MLIAWLAKIPGVTPETAYVALVWLAFLGSAAAVFVLWRRMGAARAPAAQAAVLALLAPSGFLAIFERGEIDRLLFWKLVPFVFLAIDGFRRKPNLFRIAIILGVLAAMALSRSERLIAFDLIALAEWILIVALCRPWREGTSRARFAAAGAALGFVAIGLTRLEAVQEAGALPPMPPELAVGEGLVGPLSLDAELSPFLRPVHALINSELRPRESLLWLQALGAKGVVAPAHGKFRRMLECVKEQDGWCLFDTATPAPPAVLVSRERFETLKPIRGLFDVEGLERYLVWAMRPEAVGFDRTGDDIVIRADSGPDDLILARIRDAESTAGDSIPPLAADPLGFAVLEPRGPGGFEARIRSAGLRHAENAPDDADYPRIAPEGVVDAASYTAPPFASGIRVAIFGERFRPNATAVYVDATAATVEYVSTTQINIVLPSDLTKGEHALVVDCAGARSYPYPFEALAR
jgi:hypothetical protein